MFTYYSLKKAIEREEMVLHYQPVVDINEKKITGFEALIRWNHPELGLISPDHFIPIAERTGLIIEIGDWVLKQVCAQIRIWKSKNYPTYKIFINISPEQVNSTFIKTIKKYLKEAEIEAKYIGVEITENKQLGQIRDAKIIIKQLYQMGIEVAIDDFGTGYSSLYYLKNFKVKKIKIDRHLINDITTNSVTATIVKGVINIAYELKLIVVVEGVEKVEQIEFLKNLKCYQMQGYYFSKPLPVDKTEDLIREGDVVIIKDKYRKRR